MLRCRSYVANSGILVDSESMKILIVGAGVVGESLAEQLSVEGHQVAVIDQDRQKVRAIGDKLDVLAVWGNAGMPSVLKRAGIESAGMVIAVSDVDEVNLVVGMLASRMDVKHRIVRLRNAVRMGEKAIEPGLVSNILAFGVIYSATFVLGVLVMAACGYDLVSSASASAAALGNIGPGLGAVGPLANWAHLPDVAKWVMSLLMLLGRLEIFSVLILFTPWAWKR